MRPFRIRSQESRESKNILEYKHSFNSTGWTVGTVGEGGYGKYDNFDETPLPSPIHAGSWVSPEKTNMGFRSRSLQLRYFIGVLFAACLFGVAGFVVHTIVSADAQASGDGTTFSFVNVTSCSNSAGEDVGLQSGLVKLALSKKNRVCVLMNGENTILGRSYNGENWERSATGQQVFDCSAGEICTSNLPDSGDYTLQSFGTGDGIHKRHEISRFLTQATFGPTRGEVFSFRGSFKNWIIQQMELPASLHRRYFRQKVNSEGHKPNRAGRGRSACERGSRWVQFAFTSRDTNKVAVITKQAGIVRVSIDGFFRTRVPESSWGAALRSSPVTICNVRELRNGRVQVAKNCRRGAKINLQNLDLDLPNRDIPGDRRVTLPGGAKLEEMAANVPGVKILRHNQPVLPKCNEPGNGAFFLRDRDNKLYHHDKRLLLLENTVENPASFGYSGQVECPNAIKNFVNLEGCVIGGRACDADGSLASARHDDLVEICGSPGEVANEPEMGNRFLFARTTGQQILRREENSLDFRTGATSSKQMIWNRMALEAPDQLRQRIAFALSQITVVTALQVGLVEAEMYLNYYDIYVRHAFGNYGDVLKEVTYHPLMGLMLTYRDSRALQSNFQRTRRLIFPDENYAREIMQLFSIGLVQLEMDGTPKTTAKGTPLQTYTNADIMAFSRIFTGFRYQEPRSNIEGNKDNKAPNRLDPMRLDASFRDIFPKMNLYKGHIGDGYPLCSDLPPRMFLRKGATYSYIGRSTEPKIIEEDHGSFRNPGTKRVVLKPASALYKELCKSSGGKCRYSSQVVLTKTLGCTDQECKVDAPRVVKVGNAHYEYVRPACVEFPFLQEGIKIVKSNKADAMCVDKKSVSASAACCNSGRKAIQFCEFHGERLSFGVGQERCKAAGRSLCDFTNLDSKCSTLGYFWTDQPCSVDFKVREDGYISLVHKPAGGRVLSYLAQNNVNFFRVNWEGDHPKPSNNCLGICAKAGDVCSCEVKVVESAVFDRMPGKTEVEGQLHIGSLAPDVHETYTLVKNEGGVKLFALAKEDPFRPTSIFEVQVHGKQKFFRNKMSMVVSANGSKRLFRNPANLMNLIESTVRDARYEVDALIQHLLHHSSTPPFIALRMIQRFVLSNPSPRYIKAVATAFAEGSYDGIGSGDYGDLGATMAAVLLDREARTVALDYDPSHGMLREPLLKVTHFIRSMELSRAGNKELEYFNMVEQIAQEAHAAPNVFNFFRPEFSPFGPVSDARMVAPEAEIMTSPRVIGYLNGMISAAKFGMTDCFNGFTTNFGSRQCNALRKANNNQIRAMAIANLDWTPVNGVGDTNAIKVVNELDIILTAGRLDDQSKAILRRQYDVERRENGPISAIKVVQQLITSSPEFQVTNYVQRKIGSSRPTQLEMNPSKRYKAIVYLYLAGGLDSFNLLVPHSNCGEKDMFREYTNVRGDVALPKGDLLPIDVPKKNQVCDTFGIHSKIPMLRNLYNDEDAVFLANVGPLAEPLTKAELLKGTKLVPDALFSHNIQSQVAQTLEPLKRENAGILGRAHDVLIQHGYSPGSFSITGKNNVLEPVGQISAPQQYLSRNGVSVFNPSASGPSGKRINEAMMLLNKDEAKSIYAETWGSIYEASVNQTSKLARVLRKNSITPFRLGGALAQQFEQVAKLIKSRNDLKMDRQAFYVQLGGFDTHSDNGPVVAAKLQEINQAITKFVAEMKRQKVWNDVVIVEVSEFGRTITSNGAGTDHGWGGHYAVMGGGLKGKQILGKYPEDLTSSSPDYIGRGRFLPTMGWESVWNSILQWYGVPDNRMTEAIPFLNNFKSQLLQRGDLFK